MLLTIKSIIATDNNDNYKSAVSRRNVADFIRSNKITIDVVIYSKKGMHRSIGGYITDHLACLRSLIQTGIDGCEQIRQKRSKIVIEIGGPNFQCESGVATGGQGWVHPTSYKGGQGGMSPSKFTR